ncbi:MAG: NADH-quinone oxidoreductase subunit C [Bacteroidia bacterium]|jgi:NADH:ubiquinone oxidoreductase subunit C
MNKEELKNVLSGYSSNIQFDETTEPLSAIVPAAEFFGLMQFLRKDAQSNFDFLNFMTCVDWKDHFMLVYFLHSTTYRHDVMIKVKLENRDEAEIETVCNIWRTAEFHEREVFDLFGVKFTHHPDLRRIFLDDAWEGHPLRKDYTDENMIEL